MGGYDPNPPSDGTPRTAAEADAQNYIGQRNRQAAGLSGYGGRSQEEIDFINRQSQLSQDQQRYPSPQQQAANRAGFPPGYVGGELMPDGSIRGGHPAEAVMEADRQAAGYDANRAHFDIMNVGYQYEFQARSGFTPLDKIGNEQTQSAFREARRLNPGMSTDQQWAVMGTIIEGQRKDAYKTPSAKDDRLFEQSLQQWGQNYSERSAGQHAMLKGSGISGSNVFETQGDLAVEFLKGSPKKSSEQFSPISGVMSSALPNKQGVQEYSWERAIANDKGKTFNKQVSFSGAVEMLGNSRGSLFDSQIAQPSKSNQKNAYTESNLPAPFISKVSDDLFAGASVTNTYRPNDLTLYLMSKPNGQGRGDLSRNILIGISDFMFPGSFIENKVGKEQDITRTKYDTLFQSGQPMATFKYINPDTNKATDKMRFNVGEPYVGADGKLYQDYKDSDLSKLKITPALTTITKNPSGFERGETNFASQITKKYMPDIKLPRTGTTADYNIGFVENAYAGVREKPLTASINAGIGLGLTALTVGVINPAVSGLAASTAAAGSRLALPAAALNFGVTKALPAALTGIYAVDYTSSSTLGFTDFSPKSAERGGYRFGYETAPMIMGGLSYLPISALAPKGIASTKAFVNRQLYSSPSGPDFTISRPAPTIGRTERTLEFTTGKDVAMKPGATIGRTERTLEFTTGKDVAMKPGATIGRTERTLELWEPSPRSGMRNDDAYLSWGGGKRKYGYTMTETRPDVKQNVWKYVPQVKSAKVDPNLILQDIRPDLIAATENYPMPEVVTTRAQALEISGGPEINILMEQARTNKMISDWSNKYWPKTAYTESSGLVATMQKQSPSKTWSASKASPKTKTVYDYGLVATMEKPIIKTAWSQDVKVPTKVNSDLGLMVATMQRPIQKIQWSQAVKSPTKAKTEYGLVATMQRLPTANKTRLESGTTFANQFGTGTKTAINTPILTVGWGNDIGTGSRVVTQTATRNPVGTRTIPPIPPRITPGYTPVTLPIIPPFSYSPGGYGSAYGGRKRKKPFLELFNTRRGSMQQAFKMRLPKRLW